MLKISFYLLELSITLPSLDIIPLYIHSTDTLILPSLNNLPLSTHTTDHLTFLSLDR